LSSRAAWAALFRITQGSSVLSGSANTRDVELASTQASRNRTIIYRSPNSRRAVCNKLHCWGQKPGVPADTQREDSERFREAPYRLAALVVAVLSSRQT